jgi:hypothetical protein
MANSSRNIINALEAFGIEGRVSARYAQLDRVKVFVNGKYFGLWDCEKNTFVD